MLDNWKRHFFRSPGRMGKDARNVSFDCPRTLALLNQFLEPLYWRLRVKDRLAYFRCYIDKSLVCLVSLARKSSRKLYLEPTVSFWTFTTVHHGFLGSTWKKVSKAGYETILCTGELSNIILPSFKMDWTWWTWYWGRCHLIIAAMVISISFQKKLNLCA